MSLPSLQVIAQALGGYVSGKSVLAPGPGHSAGDHSMSVTPTPGAQDGFLVHTFSPKDDDLACKDYVRAKLGIQREVRNRSAPSASIINMQQRVSAQSAPKPGPVVANYEYLKADGSRYLQATRHDPKDFRAWHWNGRDYVLGGTKNLPKVPYHLPELIAAVHDVVFVTEGEKDADRLAAARFVATTNISGAGKWTGDLNEHFHGKRVFILPDNDEAGANHAHQVAENLHGIASEVRILNLPGLPPKGDVSDWIEAGGDTGRLIEMAEAAPIWSPDAPDLSSQSGTKPLIVSSREFIEGFVPPDYLIDGLLQKRFCYSMTAPTGSGKTALLLLFSASIALGWNIGDYPAEPGRVLYLAGENPDDVRMRWLAMADALGFDTAAIDVHFLPGVFKLSKICERISAEVERIGPVALVIVDTSAAYFEGDDENGNVQMGVHARRLRSLVSLPGEPCVLIACHPVKNAGPDNLLPRGGGAFVAEVDGNLTCSKTDSMVTLHWQGKFRGPDFAPVPFTLVTATTERLKDSKGRLIPSVYAKPLSEKERSEAEASTRSDEDALLVQLAGGERASYAGLATALGWILKDGKPNKPKVQRAAKRLKADKLVKLERDGLTLTDKGKTEAKCATYNAEAAGSKYG